MGGGPQDTRSGGIPGSRPLNFVVLTLDGVQGQVL